MAVSKSAGTTFEIGSAASPTVFSRVARVSAINGPDGQAAEIDVSALDSERKEWLMGLADEGNITVSLFTDTADTLGQEQMRTAREDGGARSFRITHPTGKTRTFTAFVKSFTENMDGPDSAIRSEAQLRITGVVVRA